METGNAMIGALIFIVLVVGVNFIMYVIVRGAFRHDKKDPLERLTHSLKTTSKKEGESMHELRRRILELERSKKGPTGDSE
ncbi:MAG: hypothetical protein QY332_02865 [Anaerolineales bacterium]|nr:MAG: hypothetical protein QY332_02865 [Anaerolineales bacterium]